MISLPASPKPSARRDPSLMMAFSRIFVSRVALLSFSRFTDCGLRRILALAPRSFATVCGPCSSSICQSLLPLRLRLGMSCSLNCRSPSLMAYSGSWRMMSTLMIILSMGKRTSWSASLLNIKAPIARTMTTNPVCTMPKIASHSIRSRWSKTKTNCPSMCCWKKSSTCKSGSGVNQNVSCNRNLLRGHGNPLISETPRMVDFELESRSLQLVVQGLASAALMSPGRLPTTYCVGLPPLLKISSQSAEEFAMSWTKPWERMSSESGTRFVASFLTYPIQQSLYSQVAAQSSLSRPLGQVA
mmetsp:Transcript_75801/g.245404  ORF Transcript_75801/g.245404 Transcript_75801/m.245404 type:complete len:300 (-) Transcript_75801:1162-2061(-)